MAKIIKRMIALALVAVIFTSCAPRPAFTYNEVKHLIAGDLGPDSPIKSRELSSGGLQEILGFDIASCLSATQDGPGVAASMEYDENEARDLAACVWLTQGRKSIYFEAAREGYGTTNRYYLAYVSQADPKPTVINGVDAIISLKPSEEYVDGAGEKRETPAYYIAEFTTGGVSYYIFCTGETTREDFEAFTLNVVKNAAGLDGGFN